MNARSLVAAAAVLLGSTSMSLAQSVEWAAGQVGAGWYTMTSGMGKLIEERNAGVTVKVVPGAATANPTRVQQNQSQLALSLDILAKAAREGTLIYKDKPHDKLMMVAQSFADSYLHLIRAKSATLSFEDVFKAKGVRIGVTKEGFPDEMGFRFFQEYFDTSYDKMRENGTKIVQGDYNELAAAFKSREIDYLFVIQGVPGAMVQDIQQVRDAELVAVPEKIRRDFVAKYGYSMGNFPKTTYPKYQTDEVPTIVMATTLMVNSGVTDDVVYKITKTLCDNTTILTKIHVAMNALDCKAAAKSRTVPIHPGAIKYYKEMGYGD